MKNYGIGFFNAFLLAMAVYAGLIFFIFFKSDERVVRFTDTKDFIEVEIGEYQKPQIQVKPEKKPKIQPKPKEEVEKIGQATTNKEVKTQDEDKSTNLNELFGDTKEFQEKTTKVQSSEQSIPDATKPKESSTAEVKSTSLMPPTAKQQKLGESNKKKQKGLYDKFLGAIERKLHENWNLYERNGNFVAQIEYQIESNGFFRYTSVTKSGNTEFDAKVMDFLSTLDGKYVAAPPNKKPYKGSAKLSDEITMMGE